MSAAVNTEKCEEARTFKQKTLTFLRERLPIKWEMFHALAAEPIPKHMHKWWFCLGGTPLIFFLIQVITGVCLTFFYVPHPAQAYESVKYIQNDVAFGWWVRGLHKWSSNLMIIVIMLHMIRVFFTNSYRRPREFTWMTGALVLGLTLGFAFTGYALVYDQLSYWATQVGTSIPGSIPLIGTALTTLLRGGPDITPNTLTRLFVFHMGVFPVLMFLMVALHLILVRVHGVNPMFEGEGVPPPAHLPDGRINKKDYYPFMPDHLMTELGVALVAVIALTILAIKLPATIGYPADPNTTPEHIKPEWFFYGVFRWLKMIQFKFILPAKLWGILTSGLVYLGILAWPFFEMPILKKPKLIYLTKLAGLAFIAMFIILTIYEATH